MDGEMPENRSKKVFVIIAIGVVLAGLLLFAGSRFAASYYLSSGITELGKDQTAKARMSLYRSLAFADRPEPYFYLGKSDLGKSEEVGETPYPRADYQSAISNFEAALAQGLEKKNKDLYAVALNDLGFSYWTTKNYEKSNDYFLKLIEISPDRSFVARYFVALDYFNRANKPKEALEILRPAPDQVLLPVHEQNLFHTYTLLGRLSLYFDDFENMEKYASLAIEHGGKDNNAVDIQISRGLLAFASAANADFARTETELQKVRELSGSENVYRCTRAKALLIGKRYQEAVTTAQNFRKAADPYVESVCLAALVDSYVALGNTQEARRHATEYEALTDKIAQKNIFVIRDRERFSSFSQ